MEETGYVRRLIYIQNMHEVCATLVIFRGKKLLLAYIDNKTLLSLGIFLMSYLHQLIVFTLISGYPLLCVFIKNQ